MTDDGDRARLAEHIDAWWLAVGEVTALLDDVKPEQWDLPTDLPGWSVRDVAAHLAHLEAVLSGGPDDRPKLEPVPAHVRNPIGHYTEQGVAARRGRAPEDLVAELRAATAVRHEEFVANPPSDGRALPARTFADIDWNNAKLLSNRVIDVWMHEQDIRRAIGRPGDLDSPAARHTVAVLLGGMSLVLAKRAQALVGSSLVIDLDGAPSVAFGVEESGRGVRLPQLPEAPTVGLGMDVETFVRLAGGRGRPPVDAVTVEGDDDLARRVLEAMALTF